MPLAGTDCRPLLLRQRAGRPQLKRDPLGSDVSARMTATPLIQISEERQQQELRRAIASGAAERRRAWRFHVIALLCLAWLLLGFALLGLAFHLTDGDQVRAAFLLAFLIGYGGPVWTLIIAHWSASQS